MVKVHDAIVGMDDVDGSKLRRRPRPDNRAPQAALTITAVREWGRLSLATGSWTFFGMVEECRDFTPRSVVD